MEENLEQYYEELRLAYTQGDPAAVEGFLRRSINGRTEAEGSELLLAAWNGLGAFYRDAGRYEESLEAFRQARELAADISGPESGDYAAVLNNMAGACLLAGSLAEAEAMLRQAMEVCRRAGLEDSNAYTSVLNNLSRVYQKTGEIGSAVRCLEAALEHFERRQDHRQDLAIAYSNLATLHHAAGDQEKAMRCVNRALAEYEQCAEDERSRYAEVLNSLAGFLYDQGHWRRALALYRQSARYTRQYSGENEAYGVTCQNMRWAYEKLGKRRGAMAALARAKVVYTRLFGPDSDRARAVSDELRRLQGGAGR